MRISLEFISREARRKFGSDPKLERRLEVPVELVKTFKNIVVDPKN